MMKNTFSTSGMREELALALDHLRLGRVDGRAHRELDARDRASHVRRGRQLAPQLPEEEEGAREEARGRRPRWPSGPGAPRAGCARRPRARPVEEPPPRRGRSASCRCPTERNCEHRDGVSVSASSSESSTATLIVTPNWKKNLPDDALHERDGQEDGHDGRRRGQRRERDLARARDGGPHAALAVLRPAEDVLEHHDRVVHDDADGEREARAG